MTMATIGVLTYTLSHGLKIKSHASGIANILNSNNGTSNAEGVSNHYLNNNKKGYRNKTLCDEKVNQNDLNSKVDQFGIIRDIMVMRRKQKIMPLTESSATNIQQGPQPKRPRLSEVPTVIKQTAEEIGLAARKVTPQPQAVARRNARERNRVKQVNNGFAALREHIPEEVAAAFEAGGGGRGANKKLSKVETLRMAVAYIRSLEKMLGLDSSQYAHNNDSVNRDQKTNSFVDNAVVPTNETITVIKTENCSSPIDELFFDSSCDHDENAVYYTDDLPDLTTVNGQQYVRIPGTNTYQLVTPDMFENEENIQPIPVAEYDNMQLSEQLDCGGSRLSTEKYMPTTLSTVIAHEELATSDSPLPLTVLEHNKDTFMTTSRGSFVQHNCEQPINLQGQGMGKSCESLAQNFFQPSSRVSSPQPNLIKNFVESSQIYDAVVPRKRRIKQETLTSESQSEEEIVEDQMSWWEPNSTEELI